MAQRAIRWDQLSLRNKLTLVIVALLTFGIVVAGIGTTLLLRPTLVGQLDAQLVSIAADPVVVVGGDVTTQRFSYDNVRQAPQPYYVAVIDDAGNVLVDNWGQRPRAIAPSLEPIPLPEHGTATLTPRYEIVELSDGLGSTWRAVAIGEHDHYSDQVRGTLVIALPMASVNATMASFLAIFFGFGLTVVIFGAALTRLLVSATLAPLRVVEQTAMSFAAGDYAKRLPDATPNTEVGRLSRSLNSMLTRIDESLDERQRTIARMRRFVGDASHELRTPLVTVRGYAELYRMGALDEPAKVQQAMDRIEGEALRMGDLVEDLLQLARLDETRELQKDIIDLEPIAEDAAFDATAQAPDRTVRALPMRVHLEETGASIEAPRTPLNEQDEVTDAQEAARVDAEAAAAGPTFEDEPEATMPDSADEESETGKRRRWRRPARPAPTVSRAAISAGVTRLLRRGNRQPPTVTLPSRDAGSRAAAGSDVPAMVHANEHKVRQAVSNLIGNALRYTPAGSPLELQIVLHVPERIASIEIIDHGDGIPKEIRQKIFRRFWRADTSRARETGGSGLGLAIVEAIMRAHDGSVDIVATPGGGATFRLHFPLLVADDVDEELSTGDSPETT